MDGKTREGRKIQFSVPSATPTQLDPRQVEMIRRRRPTPAMLFQTTDHPSPEDEHLSCPMSVCENGVSKPKMLDPDVYQPPSLTAVQKLVQAHIESPAVTRDSPSSESSDSEEDVFTDPARVDSSDDNRCSQTDYQSASVDQHLEDEAEEEGESKEEGDEKDENTNKENTSGQTKSEPLASSTSPESLTGDGKGKKEAETERAEMKGAECETTKNTGRNEDRREPDKRLVK